MAKKSFRLKNGVLKLKPRASIDNAVAGDFYVNLSTGLLNTNDGSDTSELITLTATQTLENKTFTSPVVTNPTGITKTDIGLGNVDNVSDANAAISTLTQTALDNKQPLNSRLTQIAALTPSNDDVLQQNGAVMSASSVATIKTDLALVKADFGLGNVDNTSDATQNAAVASLTNKTIVTPVMDEYLDFNKESEPSTPSAGKVRFYAGTDNEFYKKTSDGNNQQLGTFGDSTYVSFPSSIDFNFIPSIGVSQFNSLNLDDIANPSVLPDFSANSVAWSPNNEFLVLCFNGSPHIAIYQKSGTTFTRLSNPASLPAGNAEDVAWSPNGEFLACAHATSPYVTIYQRSGSTFTKLADPGILPTGNSRCLNWSLNGEFLAIAHNTSPYITIYQRSGTTFTKLTDPGTLPPGNAFACVWSPNGEFLAVGYGSSPYITIYQRSGSTFTKLTGAGGQFSSSLPAGSILGLSWSPNGEFLAVSSFTTPYILIYQVSGTTFTKLPNPTTLPPFAAQNSSWTFNNEFLAVAHSTTPYITIYQVSDTTFTKLPNPTTLPTGNALDCEWTSDGEILAIGHQGGVKMSLYQTIVDMPSEGLLKLTKKEKSF